MASLPLPFVLPGAPDPRPCPCCGVPASLVRFYRLDGIPVQSNILHEDAAAARAVATGDLHLAECRACGYVGNLAFDPATQELSQRYEVTQGCSAAFGSFITGLAEQLIDRHDLRGRTIVEIGCGAGEFLAALCTLGDNRGIGIDPATDPSRLPPSLAETIRILPERWDARHAALEPDVVCCRHTLEHIHDPLAFITAIRSALADRPETLVIFEVPDITRILADGAFWDLYYEHCAYYQPETLVELFRRAGYDVLDAERVFNDQYLLLTARVGRGTTETDAPPIANDPAATTAQFRGEAESAILRWREALRGADGRVALWGSGSKAVGFLSTVDQDAAIDCIVDINPRRHGKFSPGSGLPIVGPEDLVARRPDLVIIMNPAYRDEISRDLDRLGVPAEIRTT